MYKVLYIFCLLNFHMIFAEEDTFKQRLQNMKIPDKYNLHEIVVGNLNAKHTVIIYTSFSCGHCKKFFENHWEAFCKKYVDTGRVKVYLRQYLDDLAALDSSILVRCFGNSNAKLVLQFYKKIFAVQNLWMESDDPKQFIRDIFIKSGYKNSEINGCLKRIDVSAGLMKNQQIAHSKYEISIVPAYVINGKVHEGAIEYSKLESLIAMEK